MTHNEDLLIEMLQKGTFEFKTLENGSVLAGYISKNCENPVLVELAINEIVINAVVYSLGIDSPTKTMLFSNNTWSEKINNKNKSVTLEFERLNNSIKISVIDHGPGFNLTEFINNNNNDKPSLKTHGRGIMMIKQLFPDLNSEILRDINNKIIGTKVYFSIPTQNLLINKNKLK